MKKNAENNITKQKKPHLYRIKKNVKKKYKVKPNFSDI